MIWKHLGFTKDIFFVDPLKPNKDDIDLFVGRDDEIKRYLVDSLSGAKCLKVVGGLTGVGKTTFVNACQYFSYVGQSPQALPFDIPIVLPCFEKIQIRESNATEGFMAQVLNAVCQSIAFHCRLKNEEAPSEVRDILSVFLDLFISTGGGGRSVSGSVMGTGGSVGHSLPGRAQNIIQNGKHHLTNLVEVCREKLGMTGVFVTVNNLDILRKDRLISFLNESRDEFFDIEGIYWTLIGRKGLGSVIETEAERVADYLSGTELTVEPLDLDRTMEIINTRVEAFAAHKNAVCPLSDDVIRTFHRLSMKETRETLKICGDIVKLVISIDPSLKQIPDNKATEAYIQYAQDRARNLSINESQVRILIAVSDRSKCRPKDFEKFGYSTPQGFSAALLGLVKKRLLSVEEQKNARFYKMTGMSFLAGVTGALGADIQRMALGRLRTKEQYPGKQDESLEPQLELSLDEE